MKDTAFILNQNENKIYPNGLTPECVSMWILRFDLFLNVFGHFGQLTFGNIPDPAKSRFVTMSLLPSVVNCSPASESANEDLRFVSPILLQLKSIPTLINHKAN